MGVFQDSSEYSSRRGNALERESASCLGAGSYSVQKMPPGKRRHSFVLLLGTGGAQKIRSLGPFLIQRPCSPRETAMMKLSWAGVPWGGDPREAWGIQSESAFCSEQYPCASSKSPRVRLVCCFALSGPDASCARTSALEAAFPRCAGVEGAGCARAHRQAEGNVTPVQARGQLKKPAAGQLCLGDLCS